MAYNGVEVEWDAAKDAANQEKHGLSFHEVSALFTPGHEYLELYDDAHSGDEERFIAVGSIARGVVVVVWTERDDDVVRIISARFATARERAAYLRYMVKR
jgi:uncharacterized protein